MVASVSKALLMNMEGNKVTTRQMLLSDIQAVVELQGRVFPGMAQMDGR
jgi:hypothetical protein